MRSIPYLARRLAAALSDDPALDRGCEPDCPATLALATAAFAVLVVGLATLMALGLDALLNLEIHPAGEGW